MSLTEYFNTIFFREIQILSFFKTKNLFTHLKKENNKTKIHLLLESFNRILFSVIALGNKVLGHLMPIQNSISFGYFNIENIEKIWIEFYNVLLI